MKCDLCKRTLEDGQDVIEVQEGLLGLRGFISLVEKPLTFCSADCVKEHYDSSKGEVYRINRKVP